MWNSKPKKTTCNCRRKSRGNPKVGAGCCYDNLGLRDVVIERIAGKRKAKVWLDAAVAGVELDDVEL